MRDPGPRTATNVFDTIIYAAQRNGTGFPNMTCEFLESDYAGYSFGSNCTEFNHTNLPLLTYVRRLNKIVSRKRDRLL